MAPTASSVRITAAAPTTAGGGGGGGVPRRGPGAGGGGGGAGGAPLCVGGFGGFRATRCREGARPASRRAPVGDGSRWRDEHSRHPAFGGRPRRAFVSDPIRRPAPRTAA